jgi:hypothetical protein
MYEKPEALDSKLQGDLKFNPTRNYLFAAGQHLVPLVGSEIAMAAKFYTIAFLEGNTVSPQALLGLQEGKNAFVDQDGNWKAPYIPAFIRRYPFILGRLDESNEFAVMIDRASAQFSKTEGSPLFTDDGRISAQVQKVTEFLKQLYQESITTANLCRRLEEMNLLTTGQIEFRNNTGKKVQITGLRVVNREKLIALAPAVLSEWAKNGLLEWVYAHLNSISNIQRLIPNPPNA